MKCYQLGEGVEVDWAMGEKWLRQASAGVEQQTSEFKIDLGGEEATSSSIAQMYMWAAKCFEQGKEVERDTAEAVRLYRLSAEQGNADAQDNLGVCYAMGTGVQRDEVEAVRLFRLSVEQGNALAQCDLAFCYSDGRGVLRDEVETVQTVSRARQSMCTA